MSRRLKSERKYKLIAFKGYFDTDEDVLDWWESIEEGERSDVIKDLIRENMDLSPQYRKNIELPELQAMQQDTHWIKEALNDMPAYLERVIAQVAATRQVKPQSNPTLSAQDRRQREANMRARTW